MCEHKAVGAQTVVPAAICRRCTAPAREPASPDPILLHCLTDAHHMGTADVHHEELDKVLASQELDAQAVLEEARSAAPSVDPRGDKVALLATYRTAGLAMTNEAVSKHQAAAGNQQQQQDNSLTGRRAQDPVIESDNKVKEPVEDADDIDSDVSTPQPGDVNGRRLQSNIRRLLVG